MMLNVLKQKLFLMIGRGILKAINNEAKIMKVQVAGLKDETLTDVERPQNYGFESYPDTADNIEAVLAFIGGNRDQGLALILHDRTNRPSLNKGESMLWSKYGKNILLKNNNTIEMGAADQEFVKGTELQNQINQLRTDYNTFVTTIYNLHTHVETGGVTAVPVPTGAATTADFSNIKSTVIKGE